MNEAEEIKEMLEEIVFEALPETTDWGKPSGQDRQFLNAQVSTYGKKNYVDFGKDALTGVLKITVINARLERDVEVVGKMDPYVVIANGKNKVKTTTKDDAGQVPEWNETFEIDIKDTKKLLEITVRDSQTFTDRDIGATSIRVDKLTEGSTIEKGWPLKFGKENAGTLNLKSEWIPDITPIKV